jgi:Fe-S cluster assembly scaffold protein SufB
MNSRPIYQHEYDNARRLQIEMQESALAANKAMIEMNNRHRNYLNQNPKIEIRREVETQYHVIEVPTPVENDNWEDKFNLELAQREIKNLKEEIKDEAADVVRLRGLLNNAYELISKWQEHTRYYEEQALYYRSEFQRLGGVKPAPAPQTITRAEKNAVMEWIDCNIGSGVTMKYPAVYLAGRGARGEVLSIAYAGAGQHQDAGAKMVHLAPDTTSRVVSKSIAKDGGRTSYRGLVHIAPGAKNAKASVVCDALLLDDISRSDTYPTMRIHEESAELAHEATVERIGEDKLFYLTSRGISEGDAEGLLVNGFIDPVVKEIPLEYSIELNRLIHHEMKGSIG